jgi:ABC-type multidrug transport system fused ATPase/permease subunit
MLDIQQHAYYLTCTAQSWLAVRLELIGTFIITFACLSAVMEHAAAGADDKFASLAGLSISYALSVTQSLNWTVRMASDMEANMVAVERVKEYSRIENEGARQQALDQRLPVDWPAKGEIEFEGVKLRYRPELPLALNGLDLRIPAGSKVGVVGRTGAGKSTLMAALMRIVELSEGRIMIDGTDIRKIGLVKLRRGLAVIPQDPILFSGTIRNNLDPFNNFRDEELYNALESVGLYSSQSIDPSVSYLSNVRVDSLEEPVNEGGSNLSVGQRQLLVIARALLRKARIIILDEATAAIDAATDAGIQRVMKTQFADCSCLTVAHRLNTVVDSDLILVMDDGRAAEFDSPKNLLRKQSLFRALVEAAASRE